MKCMPFETESSLKYFVKKFISPGKSEKMTLFKKNNLMNRRCYYYFLSITPESFHIRHGLTQILSLLAGEDVPISRLMTRCYSIR